MTVLKDVMRSKTVGHPETGEIIVNRNELIDADRQIEIVEAGIEEVTNPFRS